MPYHLSYLQHPGVNPIIFPICYWRAKEEGEEEGELMRDFNLSNYYYYYYYYYYCYPLPCYEDE